MTIEARFKQYALPVLREFVALGLDPLVAAGIAHHESLWNPTARSKPGATDDALGGAWGLFQMTVDTSRWLGFSGAPEELLDAGVNAHWAAKLMQTNAKTLGFMTNQDTLIAAHNCGAGAVLHNRIPQSTCTKYVPGVKAAMILWAPAVAALKF